MKKFILILLLCVTCVTAFSQKIVVDKYNEDGSRVIVIKERLFGVFRHVGIFLGFSDNITAGGLDTYAFRFLLDSHYKRTLSKGCRLLFKFEDDSIIELENKEYVTSDSRKGTWIVYEIKEDDIKKIINGKVVKLRMENDVDYDDLKIRGKRFSELIKGFYDSIQEAKKKNKNDLYKDF